MAGRSRSDRGWRSRLLDRSIGRGAGRCGIQPGAPRRRARVGQRGGEDEAALAREAADGPGIEPVQRAVRRAAPDPNVERRTPDRERHAEPDHRAVTELQDRTRRIGRGDGHRPPAFVERRPGAASRPTRRVEDRPDPPFVVGSDGGRHIGPGEGRTAGDGLHGRLWSVGRQRARRPAARADDAGAGSATARFASPASGPQGFSDAQGQAGDDDSDPDDGRIDAATAAPELDRLEFDGLARIHRGHLGIVARLRVKRIAPFRRP